MNAGDARSLRNPSVSKSCVGRRRGDGVEADEFRLRKTRHLGDPELAALFQDAVRLAHDVARRRRRQLVGDEGEDHEVLGRIAKRQRRGVGARVRDAFIVRDDVDPSVVTLAEFRQPPRDWSTECN